MTKLSAVLCVHNEERRLARCLEALDFADEIILVLDRCTDHSRAIGEAYGAVTISGVFPLEGARRAELDAKSTVTRTIAANEAETGPLVRAA